MPFYILGAFGRTAALLLVLLALPAAPSLTLPVLIVVFALLGALPNGLTIAVIGLLMEISPEKRRPAYSGYLNALTAPSYLLPLLAGLLFGMAGAASVFGLSLSGGHSSIDGVANHEQILRRRLDCEQTGIGDHEYPVRRTARWRYP